MSTFVYSNVILWYLVDKGRRVWTRGKKDRKQWTIELEKGQNWGLHAAGKCKMAPIWSAHKSVSFLNLDVGILGKLWLDLDSKRKQTNPKYLEYVSLFKASCMKWPNANMPAGRPAEKGWHCHDKLKLRENGRCRLQESSFRHISLCHYVGLCGNFRITFTWEDTKLVHGLGWLYLCFHRWTLRDFCGICLRAWYTGYIASNYKSFQGTWPGEKLPHAPTIPSQILFSLPPPPHQSVKNHKGLCTSKVPTNTRQEPNNEICLQYHIYIQFFKSISKGTFFWKKSMCA